jgi:DNA-binding XRE family transcriptional regulator
MPRKRTTDALAIIDRRFFASRRAKVELAAAEASAQVARRLYQLRIEAGLTQKELARFVGTTPSAISRLESDDYEGHSLALLRRIAGALGKRVDVRFLPGERRRRA